MNTNDDETDPGNAAPPAPAPAAGAAPPSPLEARRERREALTKLMEEGQLVLWGESERGLPNEIVRCAVFSAKNRNDPRDVYRANSPLVVPVIGGGEVIYIGEELRQDDETVWMQLVHMAKEARSSVVSFVPHVFIQAVGWPVKGDSYDRLLTCLRRLSTSGLEVYSNRFEHGVSTKLIAKYTYSKSRGKPWTVTVYDKDDELLFLFDSLYSRLDWEIRLALPEGVATWLHGFFASHKEPFGHKVETLAIGAGLTLEKPEDAKLTPSERASKRKERLREAKKTIKRALDQLVAAGVLTDYEITRTNVVNVTRASRGTSS